MAKPNIEIQCSFKEMVPVGDLKPNPRNRNTHPQDQIDAIAKILTYQGWRRPIVVSNRSGYISAGHGRLLAAMKLGLESVPVDFQDYVSEEMEIADMTADNALAARAVFDLAGFQQDAMLFGQDFDKSLFGFEDIDSILPRPTGLTDPDEIPEHVEPRVKLGEIYRLGNHRLMCGDSTNLEQVSRLLDGQSASMVFTDPPYNVNYGAEGNKNPAGLTQKRDRTIMNDKMTGGEFRTFCRAFIACILESTKGCVYVFGPPGPDGRIMFTELDDAMHCSTTIVWNKDSLVMGRGKYHNKYEPCWFGWVDSGNRFVDDRTLTNVWDFPRPRKSDLHPTMKPVDLVERALTHASKKGDLVLDLFGGSGTTMIAAEKSGRSSNLMELDPKYADVIVARWEAYTGGKAVLL